MELCACGGISRPRTRTREGRCGRATGPRTLHRSNLPRGRAKLVALQVAIELAGAVHRLSLPRGSSHLRDHLVRAADNTALRLTEAGGRDPASPETD